MAGKNFMPQAGIVHEWLVLIHKRIHMNLLK